MSGLELVGSIASVVQLASAVHSISKTLYEVGNALSNAPSDIADLARDLETFSEELYLLSSLVENKNSRHSDRVNRLTAKIIGDCATICVKIDRILRKLRGGGVWARVKWLYKEKDIMKLLGRLRDLKLSLMGVLGLLSALKADHMMDAMGVPYRSLLEGPNDAVLSKEIGEQSKETRQKLARVTMSQSPDSTLRGNIHTPQRDAKYRSIGQNTKGHEAKSKFLSKQSSQRQSSSSPSPIGIRTSSSPADYNKPNNSSTIPAVALIGANTLMKNSQAMESVQSFQTAVSQLDDDSLYLQDTLWENFKADGHESVPFDTSRFINDPDPEIAINQGWKADLVAHLRTQLGVEKEAAESCVASMPRPVGQDSANYFHHSELPSSVHNPQDHLRTLRARSRSSQCRRFTQAPTQLNQRDNTSLPENSGKAFPSNAVSRSPSMTDGYYECEFKPCSYRSKRKSNYKQHMEKAHGWTLIQPKNNGRAKDSNGSSFMITPSASMSYASFDEYDDTPFLIQGVNNDDLTWPTFSYEPLWPTETPDMDTSTTQPGLQQPQYTTPFQMVSSGNAPVSDNHQLFDWSFDVSPMIDHQPNESTYQKLQGSNADRKFELEAEFGTEVIIDFDSPKTSTSDEISLAASDAQGSSKFSDLKPSMSQPTELWCRAYLQLLENDYTRSIHIRTAWMEAKRNEPTTDLSDDEAARIQARDLNSILSDTRQFYLGSGAVGTVILSSIDRLEEILKVMQNTLNFKPGGLVWACLCYITNSLLTIIRNDESYQKTSIISGIADIATLVARYNIMESMYQQWPGMTLDKDYEHSLVSLCVHVLVYLEGVPSMEPYPTCNQAEQHLESCMAEVNKADEACRRFTVTISDDALHRGTKRKLDDSSESEES